MRNAGVYDVFSQMRVFVCASDVVHKMKILYAAWPY